MLVYATTSLRAVWIEVLFLLSWVGYCEGGKLKSPEIADQGSRGLHVIHTFNLFHRTGGKCLFYVTKSFSLHAM